MNKYKKQLVDFSCQICYSKVRKNLFLMSKNKSYNFDWDDNILFMPTKIVIFHKETKQPLDVSTEEFGQSRTKIGIEGKYKDYFIGNDQVLPNGMPNPHFSFINFRDKEYGVTNDFLPQVKESLKNGTSCFGPSFQSFCKALDNEFTAKRTTIITARGHHPNSLHEALAHLKELGYLKHLPPVENMHPVSSKKYDASAAHPSQKKLEILLNEFDEVEKAAKESNIPHFTGFSDDDLATYQNVKKVIEEEVKKGRWPNSQIVLYYTGHKPESFLITANGNIPYAA
jgi:hypothetical protein